ncbi:hypothetical protein CDD83_5865 [Cordyceps sp. RAO-2017]|nr:hypothetical protein CDD83_5865 [Cordyceps sp. RAO-2017]
MLEKYSIKPRPFIVELDEHPLGAPLQKLLGQLHFKAKTPRKTVPNIIINGVSIGGNDEVTKLDESGQLVAKLLEFGNKRVEVTGPSTSDLKP